MAELSRGGRILEKSIHKLELSGISIEHIPAHNGGNEIAVRMYDCVCVCVCSNILSTFVKVKVKVKYSFAC